MPVTVVRVATPGYFRTLRIPIVRGREFAASDDANPTPGFVVNQAFVDKHLAGVDPLQVASGVVMAAGESVPADRRRGRRTSAKDR